MGPGQRVRPDYAREAAKPSNIVYDDTPIRVYMARLHARLVECRRMSFRDLFNPDSAISLRPADAISGEPGSSKPANPGLHKSTLIGIFLATLELVRHHHVRVEQNALFGEIWLAIEENCKEPIDFSDADDYEYTSAKDEG
jgi:segregation and condensation protein A